MQRLLALGLALAFLAGCATPSSDGSHGHTLGTTGGPGPGAGGMEHVGLRFGLAAPIRTVRWANGTVAAQDTCNTGACLMDVSRAMHVTDVTGDLPQGIPARLRAEVTYPPLTEFGQPGGFELWVQSERSSFYSYTAGTELGSGWLDVTLAAAGAVEVVLLAGGPGGGGASTPYTLRIAIDAEPGLVPVGVPVAVHLGPGTHLMASTRAGPAAFDLYGPDDALLGRFAGSHVLPVSAPRGLYVAVLPRGGPAANFSTDAKDAGLVAMPLRLEPGPAGQAPPGGAYEAVWTVAGSPLGVGIVGRSAATPAGPPLLASAGFTMELARDNGFRLATGQVCGICLANTFSHNIGSGFGNALVGPGEYRVHAQANATYGLEVQPYAVYVER
ncbi:MAG TPA: hypothetical protein VHI93_01500 [Candidatus Thermoplasmatota archaeon]|nr:hypothetical protein [Candidatus Thermoplasmatota archaeon]